MSEVKLEQLYPHKLLNDLVRELKMVAYKLPEEAPLCVGRVYYDAFWDRLYRLEDVNIGNKNLIVWLDTGLKEERKIKFYYDQDYELRPFWFTQGKQKENIFDYSPVNNGISYSVAELRALQYLRIIKDDENDSLLKMLQDKDDNEFYFVRRSYSQLHSKLYIEKDYFKSTDIPHSFAARPKTVLKKPKCKEAFHFQRCNISNIDFPDSDGKISEFIDAYNISSVFDMFNLTVDKSIPRSLTAYFDIMFIIDNLPEEYKFSDLMMVYLNRELSDRDYDLYKMWHRGKTLKELSSMYGITSTQVSHIIKNIDRSLYRFKVATDKNDRSIWFLNIGTREFNILSRIKLIHSVLANDISVDDVIEAIEDGSFFKIRGLGVESLINILNAIDWFAGTEYASLLDGREEEILYEIKTKSKKLTLKEFLNREPNKSKIIDQKFSLYGFYEGINNGKKVKTVLGFIDYESETLVFLTFDDSSKTNKCPEDTGHPVYKLKDKFYKLFINAFTVSFDDIINSKIEFKEYKLED